MAARSMCFHIHTSWSLQLSSGYLVVADKVEYLCLGLLVRIQKEALINGFDFNDGAGRTVLHVYFFRIFTRLDGYYVGTNMAK